MTRRHLRAGCLGLAALMVLGEVIVRVWDGLHGGTGSLYDYVTPAGSRFKMRPSAAGWWRTAPAA